MIDKQQAEEELNYFLEQEAEMADEDYDDILTAFLVASYPTKVTQVN